MKTSSTTMSACVCEGIRVRVEERGSYILGKGGQLDTREVESRWCCIHEGHK